MLYILEYQSMTRHILHVTSSLFDEDGQSTRLSTALVETLRSRRPDIGLSRRRLTAHSIPHLDAATFSAFGVAKDARTAVQRQHVALSDTLIDELQAADLLILGLPMYNFSIPSTVKAWFDHLGRAGVTFRYTASGPAGLLLGKQAVIIATRGGRYAAGSDTQTPYVNQFLSFIGIEQVQWIHVEGLATGQAQATRALAEANQKIEAIATELLASGASS